MPPRWRLLIGVPAPRKRLDRCGFVVRGVGVLACVEHMADNCGFTMPCLGSKCSSWEDTFRGVFFFSLKLKGVVARGIQERSFDCGCASAATDDMLRYKCHRTCHSIILKGVSPIADRI